MSRIRSIKPEFFLHEGLADMPALHRLLFVGLWTLADKEGRLEDRPRRIKASLLPWEDCDVDDLLWELDEGHFVHRYEVEGAHYISIPAFRKHQRPHPKEPDSALPIPPYREKKRRAVEEFSDIPSTPVGREGDLGGRKEILEVEAETAPPPPTDAIRLNPEALAALADRRKPVPEDEGPNAELLRAITGGFAPPPPQISGAGFFAWVQDERVKAGFGREKPQHPAKLGTWYAQALLELNGDDGRLRAAYDGFTRNSHWETAQPPWPFNAFIANWRDYVGRKPASHAG